MDIVSKIAEIASFRVSQLAKHDGFLAGFSDPVKIILGIAKTESSFNPLVSRYEPAYKYLYHPEKFSILLGITLQTEEVQQATSWGVFQIMGAVAREFGYDHYLHLLATYETVGQQTELAIKVLHRFYKYYLKKFGSEELASYFAVAGYNAGFKLKDYKTNYFKQVLKNANSIQY